MAKPNFRALDSGGDEEDEEWSSEDAEASLSGRKRRGRRGSRSQGSSRSRQRKTAAVGELEAEAQEVEAAVAELAPQAEAWKEKYAALVEENEALKRRVEELMKQAAERGCNASGGGAMLPLGGPPPTSAAPVAGFLGLPPPALAPSLAVSPLLIANIPIIQSPPGVNSQLAPSGAGADRAPAPPS